MNHENKSAGNDDYPFVDTLDKMAKFANQDKLNQTDRTNAAERNGRQPDAHRTANHQPYSPHGQNQPAADRRRMDEHFQAGNERRRTDERFQAGNDRRRTDERFQAGNDRRRTDERFQAGNERRRTDERFQAGNDHRRTDERFQAGNERRRTDERFQEGNERRRTDERFQAGNERRRTDERFQAGNERRRTDERFPSDNDRRRADEPPKNSRAQNFAAGIAAEERTEKSEQKESHKKRPVALWCMLGVAVLAVMAVWAVVGHHSRNQGVLPDGKSVKYAAVSPSDGENGAARETAVTKAPPESDKTMVRVTDYAPTVRVDLKYAGKRNFTGKRIYDFEDAYLRYGTVKKLIKAQKALSEYGMGLMIWDAYRPHAAQKKLWEVCPNPLYVKDPGKGYSDHTRGSAVDVTLVDSDGTELLMPTGFDNFTKLADRDYSDIDNDFARDNVKLLEKTMKAAGFQAYSEEWWHFTDSVSYEVDKDFVPES